ncbi:MAG: hypothetical protein ACPLKZ_06245 [Candidatus Bathyarchaeales archaeon]
MKKYFMTFSMICFLLLAVFLTPQAISVAQASNASVTYCPNPPPEMEQGENQVSLAYLNAINEVIRDYGNFQFRTNEQESSVTRDRVGYLAYYCETNYNFAMVFYKGHSSTYNCGTRTHSFIMDYTGQPAGNIQDAYIWTKTINNRHDFVFLWSCGMASASMFPGGYCSGCGGGWGMCYSWLKITGLSSDGYKKADSSGHVFLGFNWSSPNFKTLIGNSGYNYVAFAFFFYQGLLQRGNSVNSALDYATQRTFGLQTFGDSPLYRGMLGLQGGITALKVFGDGNRTLPRR